ncbi:MgtC/SapB family protein [Thermomonas sp.]|uniref:MgtC/SapB family protein n=1 Tax=Thermomonas sp. TaxID=1971895 RepID=UPI00391969FE
MDFDPGILQGMAVALGVGLLVGVERERRRDEDGYGVAGVRTFGLIGLAGALAERVGGIGISVGGAFVVLAALASYRGSRVRDPGLTTEVAMLVVFLLGVLSMREQALAAGLGVAVTLLLASKTRAHHFVRGVLTDQELHDALLLAAAATVVLPLLPDHPIDPWRVLNPRKLWLLGVIVMAISAVGHIARRAFGARDGLLLAGFAGGFASSTATIASMGARARRDPSLAMACAGGGVISNVSTVVQLGVVVGLLSPPLLAHLWPALLVTGSVVVGFALVAARAARSVPADLAAPVGRPFEPRQALLFVAILAVVMVASAAAQAWLGKAGLGVTLALSGLADVHAAAASAAQLVVAGRVAPQAALTGIALAFATNSAVKLGVAWASGGRAYALRLLPGVVAMLVAFVLALWLL